MTLQRYHKLNPMNQPTLGMKNLYKIFVLLLFISILAGCSDDPVEEVVPEEPEATLSTSPTSFSFEAEGGTASFSITSNTTWRIQFEASDWCKPSIQTSSGNATVTLTAQANDVEEIRNLSLTITANGANDVLLEVTQAAMVVVPPDPEPEDHIDSDNTGMADDATTIASKMTLGWNLGNTLEAIGGETAWGNPKATEELIVAVKNAGFNAIRIPCAWDQYLEDQTTYKIEDAWLARVKEVVDYCVNNDLYAILNIHWDGGWLENNVTPDKQEAVNLKQAALWKQIAIHFRDYDEHLLFAGANEPNADNQEKAEVLKVYMQTFVDVVRATGGRNAYRNLIIQAPNTDINLADELMTMPTDEATDRLLAEVHYYSPWQFCGLEEDASWGKMLYFWGADNHPEGAEDRYSSNWEEDYVRAQFQKMKTKFVDQGVPMILGEYGAIRRTLGNADWQTAHDKSRAYFFEYVTQEAKNHGLVPFFWDNGGAVMDRNSKTVGNQPDLDGLIKGANAGSYPF